MSPESSQAAAPAPAPAPWLAVSRLGKAFRRGHFFSPAAPRVAALHDVTLSLNRASTLAVIGASGSGKTTLARCIALQLKPDAGEIQLAGRPVLHLRGRELAAMRRRVQLIVQDAAAALNPRFCVLDTVAEPLLIAGEGKPCQRREQAAALLELVGLGAVSHSGLPRSLSGGQRQRLAIARALAARPALLLLDEALAGLDLSIQAQIVNLLLDLQAQLGLACLYIAHDLRLVRFLAGAVAVMDGGRLAELTPAREFFRQPRSPQGESLLSAERATLA